LKESPDEVSDFVEILEFNKSELDCSIVAGAVGFQFVNSSNLNLLFNKIAIVSKVQ
jgi:hypothetical protein